MHLLQQHSFDIQCSSKDFGKEIQSQLSALLEKEFYPKLEVLLNQYTHPNHIWNIDLMELQLPEIAKEHWKTELVQKSLQQIEMYLKDNRPIAQSQYDKEVIAKNSLVSNEQHAVFLFFNFLNTGILPENTISKDLGKIVFEIDITNEFLKKLIENFEADTICLIRWIFSAPDFFKEKVKDAMIGFSTVFSIFSEEIFQAEITDSSGIKQIVTRFQTNTELTAQWIELIQWFNYLYRKNEAKDSLLKEFVKLSEKFWEVPAIGLTNFLKSIIPVLRAENKKTYDEINDFFQALGKSASLRNLSDDSLNLTLLDKKQAGQNESNPASVSDAQYVNNAGLIILHPFLKMLFEQLELCENNVWKENMSQHKAILLTQYIITGDEKIQENELVLNKILCGLPIEDVVNTKLKIAKAEKEKCHSLLQAVLEHWKIMSNSSVEALQETFLQREGKLEIHGEETYELWIEEKGYDILLGQLPWGIGMIKTPWMENYLTCHWN